MHQVGFIIRTHGVPFNTEQPFTDLTVIAVWLGCVPNPFSMNEYCFLFWKGGI